MEAIQELSERKTKILHAIIKNYLETGEPVGSRTISKYTDLNLSSATIRNEMADLEELGYIMPVSYTHLYGYWRLSSDHCSHVRLFCHRQTDHRRYH